MRTQGFTLIELLVVLAILGIVAAIGMPAMPSDTQDRLDNAQLQVQNAADYAQGLARSSRRTHGVAFDVATDRFAVVDGGGDAVVDPLTKGDYVIDFERPDQPRGVTITSAAFGADDDPALVFDGQGVPLEGGQVVLACRGATRTLLVDAATGRVSEP